MTHDERALLLELSRRLHEDAPRIMEDWIAAVHEDRRIQASETVSRSALEDHLPKILETIGEQLRLESGDNTEVICEDARKHGGYRWEQGYKLEEVVRELMLFRSIMTRHLMEIEGEQGALTLKVRFVVMERLHSLLDELSWTSTQQFVHEQQRTLVEASEARARLLYNMSHELRNLLNGLGLAAELIVDEPGEPVREMHETLSRSVSHMKELLDDLLDLSALVNGQQTVRATTFSPAGLLKHVEAVYRPMAEAKGLAFHVELDPALQTVTADERKIEQVLVNFLSNAIKYTDKGEIRAAFRRVNAEHWSLSVSDTGVGISKADQKEIFSEFYRAESTRQARGVGLGLAISCRLVELLGGELHLTSALGTGSQFEVIFPTTFQPKPAPQPAQSRL